MNITIITPSENSLTKRGNRLPFLADLLVKSGHNVRYISSNFYHGEKRSFSKKEISEATKEKRYDQIFFSVPGYQSNYSLLRTITHQIFAIKVFFYLISNPSPDLVIIPSRPPEMIFTVTMTKFLKRYKMILDVSDIWPDAFPSRDLFYIFFSIYCNFFQYLSIPFQKYFVFTSPMFLKWVQRYQKKCKPQFITLGFDKDRWNQQGQLLLKLHPIEEKIVMEIENSENKKEYHSKLCPYIEGKEILATNGHVHQEMTTLLNLS